MTASDKKGNLLISPEEQDAYFRIPKKEQCLKVLDEIAKGGKRKGAVLLITLEDFKSFNYTFGYKHGELFILEVCRYLCRIPNADVYRISGVEFIIIMEGIGITAIQEYVEKVREQFSRSWSVNGIDCVCPSNMGMTWFPGDALNADEILDHLSHAVSDAVSSGQNRVSVYDSELKEKIARKNTIMKKTAHALEAGMVELRYRPTWNSNKKRFARADSFIRMLDLETGIVPSTELMHVAEHTGQISAVSNFAIRKTCELITEFIEADKDFETIAVPISPLQFLQERFSREVRNIIEESDIPPNRLALEITDIVSMSGYSSAHDNLVYLTDMGVEIVLTEFGTGYSGLSSIMNLPVDVVKLDRLLIWQLDHDSRGPQVAEGLIQIANNLGLKLVAEGVETETQVAMLREFGCEYSQGYYYSPTLMPDELKLRFMGVDTKAEKPAK